MALHWNIAPPKPTGWLPLVVDHVSILIYPHKSFYDFFLSQMYGMKDIQLQLVPNGKIVSDKYKHYTKFLWYAEKQIIASVELGTSAGKLYMKLSLFPSHSVSALRHFLDTFDLLLDGTYRDVMFPKGRVTHLELAWDSLTVPMHSFLVYKPWAKKSNIYLVKETNELGALYTTARTSFRGLTVYDKAKHFTEKGLPVAHAIQTRFESRLEHLGVAPSELASINNPFLGTRVMEIAAAKTAFPSAYAQAFIDLAAQEGTATALSKFLPYYREQFKGMFKQLPAPWWKPEAAWAHLLSALSAIAPSPVECNQLH